MKTKNLNLNGYKIFPLGLGTYGYGEENIDMTSQEQKEIIIESFRSGINYASIYLTYANGKAAEILQNALNNYKDEVYLTFCAYPSNFNNINDLERAFHFYQDGLSANKIKTFMLSSQMEGRFGRKSSTKLLEKVLSQGIESIGLTNCNLEQLEHYANAFGDKVVLHEICHNFEIRIFEELGILQRTRALNILPVIYQPLRRNRTTLRHWPVLELIAKRYGVTVNQVILSWLVKEGMLPLIKAANPVHLKENVESMNIDLSNEDIAKINSYKFKWTKPSLNWLDFNATDSLYIAKLPNVFDEEYDKQTLKEG